jgi:hypothetical protein
VLWCGCGAYPVQPLHSAFTCRPLVGPLYSCLVGRFRRLGAGFRESGGRVSLWVLPAECAADSRALYVFVGWGRHDLFCVSDGWWREVGVCCRALPVPARIGRHRGRGVGCCVTRVI